MDNKVPQQINDFIGDNVKKLAQLFPSAVKDGEVDFEALKEELGQFEKVGSEKYELTWAGKKNAKKIAQEDVIGRTLKFIPEDSKNADATENLYIEGDNLEVLKLLRQNYYGAIKMIYIDPPYNTGNNFIYNDSFAMRKKESDILEGAIDDAGERYSVNVSSQNRYHANWMNMIYPRLQVSRDLLLDDGTIFISIDDHEVDNLLKVADEVFGRNNRMAILVWKKKYTGGKGTSTFADYHEYILAYAKDINSLGDISMARPEEEKDKFIYEDEYLDERGKYYTRPLKSNLDPRPTLVYPIELPDGTTVETQWICAEDTFLKMKAEGRIVFKSSETSKYPVYKKFYEKDGGGNVKIPSFIEESNNNEAKEELKNLFGIVQTRDLPFQTPKPVKLLNLFVENFMNDDDIVLDFFSGSASTAQSVFECNVNDGKNRRFVLVQIDEAEDLRGEKYSSICEIGKERIRRAGDKIKSEHPEANIDIGFKVFRTADTNIKWNSLMDMGQVDMNQLEYTPDLVDFMPDANDVDVVYELMLRQRDVALS